jgi:hypothetical protein
VSSHESVEETGGNISVLNFCSSLNRVLRLASAAISQEEFSVLDVAVNRKIRAPVV